MTKLIAIIPTGNEIHNIEAVIAFVNLADDVLVIDSKSNDGTYGKAVALAHKKNDDKKPSLNDAFCEYNLAV